MVRERKLRKISLIRPRGVERECIQEEFFIRVFGIKKGVHIQRLELLPIAKEFHFMPKYSNFKNRLCILETPVPKAEIS